MVCPSFLSTYLLSECWVHLNWSATLLKALKKSWKLPERKSNEVVNLLSHFYITFPLFSGRVGHVKTVWKLHATFVCFWPNIPSPLVEWMLGKSRNRLNRPLFAIALVSLQLQRLFSLHIFKLHKLAPFIHGSTVIVTCQCLKWLRYWYASVVEEWFYHHVNVHLDVMNTSKITTKKVSNKTNNYSATKKAVNAVSEILSVFEIASFNCDSLS